MSVSEQTFTNSGHVYIWITFKYKCSSWYCDSHIQFRSRIDLEYLRFTGRFFKLLMSLSLLWSKTVDLQQENTINFHYSEACFLISDFFLISGVSLGPTDLLASTVYSRTWMRRTPSGNENLYVLIELRLIRIFFLYN